MVTTKVSHSNPSAVATMSISSEEKTGTEDKRPLSEYKEGRTTQLEKKLERLSDELMQMKREQSQITSVPSEKVYTVYMYVMLFLSPISTPDFTEIVCS